MDRQVNFLLVQNTYKDAADPNKANKSNSDCNNGNKICVWTFDLSTIWISRYYQVSMFTYEIKNCLTQNNFSK